MKDNTPMSLCKKYKIGTKINNVQTFLNSLLQDLASYITQGIKGIKACPWHRSNENIQFEC